jgi:glutamate formiminotransferase/formiminotetrahydrofolate cyclodeaminase
MGWYLPEYGICQVSMNLTDVSATPLHLAFEEVCEKAEARGLRVTGSEIVGMVPLRVLREAGEYFLRKQQRSLGLPESEIVRIAVRTLGLSELRPFDLDARVIEYALEHGEDRSCLVDKPVRAFVDAVASETPTPGGGSAIALVGALGAALGTMVANGSANKRGWDDRWETFSDWAVQGRAVLEELVALVDADSAAFESLIDARRLPKDTEPARAERTAAIQSATREAILVPLRTMRVAVSSMDIIKAMAETGNPNATSDAAAGALCARTAVRGANYNVRANVAGLRDKAFVAAVLEEARSRLDRAEAMEAEILATVEARASLASGSSPAAPGSVPGAATT